MGFCVPCRYLGFAMTQLDQAIERAISKAVREKVSRQIETFVKNEVLRELRQRGINIRNNPREANNRSISLIEGRNIRRKVGSLVMDRVKDGVTEQLRFKLRGLQSRNPRDFIDSRAISDAVAKAIRANFRLK